MSHRTPPAWFVKKLRDLDPRLGVTWTASRERWTITERVRQSSKIGDLNGAPVFRLRRRPFSSGLHFRELGSRVFDVIKRNDPRRFRSVEQMIEDLDIDKNQESLVDSLAAPNLAI